MVKTIQNFEKLAENDLRRDALTIAEAGYEAINVGSTLKQKLHIENDELTVGDKKYSLKNRRIFFVSVGKCAFVAAAAIEELLGERLTSGIALDVSKSLWMSDIHSSKIEILVGTHPLPSEININATKKIITLLSNLSTDDLVIMLISGGGSTLLCLPPDGMTCDDEVKIFKELTAHGAPIQELNTVRKHLSLARGGSLARAAYPAEVLSLVVSDVPGNDMEFISSGPTVLDTSTVDDAKSVLERYDIAATEKISLIETPKEAKYFERVATILFLSSKDALVAMQSEAVRLGYITEIVDEQFKGEAREFGKSVVEKLHEATPKTAFLYAGESTVTFREVQSRESAGGRNQEMALSALQYIQNGEIVLPFASDGHDNTDHAGAIGDTISLTHAQEKNLSVSEYLDEHNSYNFFSTAGDALMTGYTGSNVSDLIIAIKK
jgi:glycerate-2-kinase